ncbi:MAG: BspA family leucine-rich repeat surface protein [Bacteroidota bacterium]
MEEEGIDFDQEFAEFAARTTVWDYPDQGISDAFRVNQKKGLNNGFPDYRFIDVMDETGTYGIYQPVPEEFLPGAYGWNALKIDSTASGTYTIKLKGNEQNPEYLDFVARVVKGKPGAYEYLDFPVNKETTLGEGEAALDVNTEAGEELYFVVTAASRDNMRDRDIPHIYEYALESSEHILPDDHIRTFSLAEEIRRAEIDHEQLTITAKVARGTDITKLKPVMTLSEGAVSSPSSEEEVDFTIPVTYRVTGEGSDTAKEWTISVSSEAERTGTDILTFELENSVRFAAINETDHTVIANLESAIDLSSVVPVFTLSEGATCQPASGETVDLTNPVTFIVTAEDGITTQEWTISAADFRPFITEWEATEANQEITINLSETEYDFSYVWKNENGETVDNDTFQSTFGGSFTVTLPTAGIYTLEIIGEYPHFTGYPTDQLKDVLQWGDIHWRDMSRSFRSWRGESFSATDLPNLRDVTSMFRMFERAINFNGDISGWDVSNVSNMNFMFQQSREFNGDISGWDVSNLVEATEMFRETRAFNADISKWNTRNLREMNRMFFSASAFDQNLGDWDIRNVTVMLDALKGGISTLNYDRTLIGWAGQNVREEVILGSDASYCGGEDARATLISEFNWNITDGGLACPEGGEAEILRFELDEEIAPAVIDDENHTITLSVPGGSNITGLEPTLFLSRGATSTPASETVVDFSEPVVFSVTSEDGNTQQDWTVTVTEALNTATDFLSFTFAEAAGPVFINLDNHAIAIKVNEGTDLSSLTPSFVLSSGATSNLESGETRDFSQSQETPVVYTITAEDEVTRQNWKVIVATREAIVSQVHDYWIDLQVFPNPTNRYFEVSGPGQMEAYITSLDGKRLTEAQSGNQLKFDLGDLTDGIYLMVVRYQNQLITQRVVKQSSD